MKSYLDEMKVGLAIVFAAVLIAVYIFLNVGRDFIESDSHGAFPPGIYVQTGNIYEGFFKEPFESVVIIVRDGRCFVVSTHHDKVIAVGPAQIYEYLLRENVNIEDIIVIVHNHLYPNGFSPGDDFFYHYFCKRGFRGVYCIWYPATKTTRIKEE